MIVYRVALGVCVSVLAMACSSKSSGSHFGRPDASSPGVPDAGGDAAVGVDGAFPILTDSGPPLMLGDDAETVLEASASVSEGGNSTTLSMTIRDFRFWDPLDPTTNPDFQNEVGDDTAIVQPTLGTDGKPAYETATPTTATTHGAMYFNQWYNDTPGTNINVPYPIALTAGDGGVYGYDSLVSGTALSATDATKEFFPIDDGTPYATAFGNQGEPHNYSFTTELHTVFTYSGGETFSFSGDDDVFVYINAMLVINLGGVHNREEESVSLDTLSLVKGQQYPLDLFGAERHTVSSNVSFETTLTLTPAPPPPPH